jgi:hypothetical protein
MLWFNVWLVFLGVSAAASAQGGREENDFSPLSTSSSEREGGTTVDITAAVYLDTFRSRNLKGHRKPPAEVTHYASKCKARQYTDKRFGSGKASFNMIAWHSTWD